MFKVLNIQVLYETDLRPSTMKFFIIIGLVIFVDRNPQREVS